MIDNTKRFSDRVENYVKYRPGYPGEIISLLADATDLNKNSRIADIGSGTGKLTEVFINSGYAVDGVEPNDEMRLAAEAQFQNKSLFRSINGSAENTSLEADLYSHVVVGQAFHWFDPILAKQEFKRVLISDGWVILVWNERDIESPFLSDYEVFLHEHAVKYSEVVHRNVDESVLDAFYEPFSYDVESLSTHQLFDFDGILGRYQSSSYAYKEGDEEFPVAKEALQVLFEKHEQNDQIQMEYLTNIYYGRLK